MIHRFLPCKRWLCDISIVNSNMFDECNTVDTFEHYIFSCKSAKTLWSEIERWWNEKSTCPVVLTEKHVIFDLYYDLTHFSAISYIILLGKMYIYNQKMNKSTIYFNYFLNELKFKLDIEKTICEPTTHLHSSTRNGLLY